MVHAQRRVVRPVAHVVKQRYAVDCHDIDLALALGHLQFGLFRQDLLHVRLQQRILVIDRLPDFPLV